MPSRSSSGCERWPRQRGSNAAWAASRRPRPQRTAHIGSVDIADMIMMTAFSHRLLTRAAICIAAWTLILSAAPARAQSVCVMVNGEPITQYDIEQRSKLNFLTTKKQPAREDTINELIDEKVKIKEAKKFGVDPSDSDIDQSYGQMGSRMRLSSDQLTKTL